MGNNNSSLKSNPNIFKFSNNFSLSQTSGVLRRNCPDKTLVQGSGIEQVGFGPINFSALSVPQDFKGTVLTKNITGSNADAYYYLNQ